MQVCNVQTHACEPAGVVNMAVSDGPGMGDGGSGSDGSSGSDGRSLPTELFCRISPGCWENPVPQGANLRAVWASRSTDAWAAGDGETLLRWDGSVWFLVQGATSLQNILGLWGSSANDIWAVGTTGAIRHFDGSSWSAVASPVTQDLYAVWGSSASDVWAVGKGGTRLHYNGTK